MLIVDIVKDKDGKWYVCNYCGKKYNLEEADVYHKGNVYFCSGECVIAYDSKGEK